MARLVLKRRVTDNPTFIITNDQFVGDWLKALDKPEIFSNTAGQVWALPANDDGGVTVAEGGTAWIVSAEALKRIEANRLS
jgi:hypothetical protein